MGHNSAIRRIDSRHGQNACNGISGPEYQTIVVEPVRSMIAEEFSFLKNSTVAGSVLNECVPLMLLPGAIRFNSNMHSVSLGWRDSRGGDQLVLSSGVFL